MILLSVTNQMLIVLLVLLVIFIVFSIIKKVNENKEKAKIVDETDLIFNKYGLVEIVDNKKYFVYNDKKYLIFYQYIGANKEMTVNSEKLWQTYGSKGEILHMNHLVKSRMPKIVIIYPTKERPKRYINENTLEFIDFQKTYTYYVILKDELEDFIKSL